jgi:molybdopterin/thiamine biosynthesis adenylyltransferase
LAEATAVIIGCGSVGAPVATLLAQAGVGRLVLIDPELLSWANIGRHSLGSHSVRRFKARELSERLRQDYPHLQSVTVRASTWQEVAEAEAELLTNSDLLISTIGSWGSEGALNEWHRARGGTPPVIYGWTEAHACAGQAVAVLPEGGCLSCGMSNVGVPDLRITEWPSGASQHQEPACGAVFQPYGPAELAHIVAMIADFGLDVLLGRVLTSTHRIWCGKASLLEAAGGAWTAQWRATPSFREHGGFLEERAWSVSAMCRCRRQPAVA